MADKYNPGMEFQSWRSLPRGPLAEVGDAAKKGLMIYGLHKVGAIDALNKIGLKQNDNGNWSFKTPPAGAVAPATPANNAPMMPVAPAVPQANEPAVPTPVVPQTNIEATPLPQMNPADAGKQILDDEFHGMADDELKLRDPALDQLPQQFAQGVAPPSAGYPQLPQSNGVLSKLLAAFG